MPATIMMAVALAATQAAAPAGGAGEGLLSQLRNCRQLADPTAKIACYDAAVAAFDSAVAEKKVVVLDREDVRETRRSLFGFNLPKLPLFGGGDGDKEEEEVVSRISAVRSLGYGKWRIRIETGAVWQTIEAPRIDIPPEIGDEVRIRRAAMGSYFMNIKGRRAVKATRES